VLYCARVILPRKLGKLRGGLHPGRQDHSVIPFREGRRVGWSLHFRFEAELILHHIGHLLN
jgi:hypothetical protein